MAKGRMLQNRISKSRRVNALKSDTARLLYTWMLSHLDVNGCFYANPKLVRNTIFPRLNHTIKKVESCLNELEEAGLIKFYKNDGEDYLYYPDFEEKQPGLRKDREAKLTILPQPTEDCRKIAGRLPEEIPHKVNTKINTKVNTKENNNTTKDMQINDPKKAAELISSIGNLPKTPIEKGDMDNDRDGEFWETSEDERLLMIVSYQARFKETIDNVQSYMLLNKPSSPQTKPNLIRLKIQKEWCNSYQRPWFELVTCAMDQLVDRSKKKKINNVFGALYDGVFSFPPYLIVVEK